MSHYFKNDPNLEHALKMIDVHIHGTSFRFYTDRGVFSKEGLDHGTKTLINSIDINRDARTLIDMGCGYGPIGISLAKRYPELGVYMVDVNERAVDLARKNASLNSVNNVDIRHGYLFEKFEEKADIIVSNPPIRAGKQTVFRLYEQAKEHLNEHGFLYVVIQKKQGAPSSLEKLKSLFSHVEIIARDRGYWVILSQK